MAAGAEAEDDWAEGDEGAGGTGKAIGRDADAEAVKVECESGE